MWVVVWGGVRSQTSTLSLSLSLSLSLDKHATSPPPRARRRRVRTGWRCATCWTHTHTHTHTHQKKGPYREALRDVLEAYAHQRPSSLGYKQGMSYLAGVLVLHCLDTDTAFRCFRAIVARWAGVGGWV